MSFVCQKETNTYCLFGVVMYWCLVLGVEYNVAEGKTDEKDETFYSSSSAPSSKGEGQYGVVLNNVFWLKTKPKYVTTIKHWLWLHNGLT